MIATGYRAKLPKHLSYPVGAEAITTALAGVQAHETLSLKFWFRPFEPASRFQGVLAHRLPYPIVVAHHRPARKPGLSAAQFMVDRGWYDARRELVVYPVLRDLRHAANRLLQDCGLPVLARWLNGVAASGQAMLTRRLELVLAPIEGTLNVSERSWHESSRV